jgi:hypothetical protein
MVAGSNPAGGTESGLTAPETGAPSRVNCSEGHEMVNWDDVVAIGTALPHVQESTSYRTPALKVDGKLIARLRTEAEGALMVRCALEEKAALLADGNPAFFSTAHYDGYPAILLKLELLDRQQLAELLHAAWMIQAPAKLRREHLGRSTH